VARRNGLNIQIKDEDFNRFTAELTAKTKVFASDIDNVGPMAGVIVQRTILNAIREQMPNSGIGDFMADRTGFDIQISGGRILVTVFGLTEGEAGNPARGEGSSRAGTVPKVKDANSNLWNRHEFGIPDDGTTERVVFAKDSGGVKAIRAGSAFGSGSPYAGEVQRIISGLTNQLQDAISGAVAIHANNVVANNVRKASKNKIVVDTSAKSALRRSKVSMTALKELQVVGVETTSKGQINLRGASGRFVSGGGKVPTKIRK
jgi:hypothetical protein